ncbi:MAG TPA: P1 family peptidase [Bacillota bacterium]
MITDVPGVRLGHAGDPEGLTGCTVVLLDEPAVGAVDVRGGAPGTRETDLLAPGRLVDRVDAVLLTGGSAFGLDAAAGVMRWLADQGRGFDAGVARVPIVPAAVLFDLGVGRSDARPDAAMGYEACRAAAAGVPDPAEGSVGAGLGATVGKALGIAGAMRGGVGSASLRLPGGATVGAVVAVNCLGDVYDPDTGRRLAGTRDPRTGQPVDTAALLLSAGPAAPAAPPPHNTTLAVVATDADLDPAGARRLAEMAHVGMARAIRPVHTQFDGDTVFAVATGRRQADLTVLGIAAGDVVARAIARAVRAARSAAGIPAMADLGQDRPPA